MKLRLRREDGQTLVFFVFMLPPLVLLLGLVIDVGAVAVSQRQLQGVADAAALAGAQSLPLGQDAADQAAANLVPSSDHIDSPPPPVPDVPNTYAIKVSRSVPSFISAIGGLVGTTATATATARVEPTQLLCNTPSAGCTPLPAGSPRLIPLVVDESQACTTDNPSCPLWQDGGGLSSSAGGAHDFGFMCEGESCATGPLGSAALNDASNALADQISGSSALEDPYCTGGNADCKAGPGAARARTIRQPVVMNALADLNGQEVILPVVRSTTDRPYEIVGFAEFKITGSATVNEIPGNFVNNRYVTPGAPSWPPESPNYGVSVIGLSH